jgi:hypothetical protein
MLGYSYIPELPAGNVRNVSTIDATHRGTNIGSGENTSQVDVVPVYLTVDDKYSSFSRDVEPYAARATRIMDASTSKLLERELWLGEIAEMDDLPNPRLATPDAVNVTPVGGPVSPQAAVARLMGGLTDAGMGDGMIHAPVSIGIRMPETWRNEQTYADHGFVVVSGTGYPGIGPNGTGTNWVYATEIVNVRLGDVEILPEDPRYGFDTATNEFVYSVRRIGAADFAGPVFACQVIES